MEYITVVDYSGVDEAHTSAAGAETEKYFWWDQVADTTENMTNLFDFLSLLR